MKLINLLENKIDELDLLEFPHETEYIYFDALDEEIAINRDLSTITDGNILMALITLYNKELDFEDVFPLFADEICPSFDKYDISNIIMLLNAIMVLEEENVLGQVLELDSNLSVEEMSKIIIDCNSTKSKVDIVSSLFNLKKYGIGILDDFEIVKKLAGFMNGYSVDISIDFTHFAMYRDNYEIIQISKNKIVKQAREIFGSVDSKFSELEKIFDLNRALDTIRKISERNFELSKQRKSFEKSITQKRMLYNKTIEYLKKMDDENSIEVPDDILQKLDDELFVDFIKIVLNNDRSVYTTIQIENIRKDKYDYLEKMFLQKQIDINKLGVELKDILIKNVKKESLGKLLYYITLPELKWLKNHPNFVQVILNTNEEILKRVTAWIKLEYISKEVVYKNIGMLLENNFISVNEKDVKTCFDKAKNNIELLSKVTDLTNKIIKNSSIIFMETSKLKQSIDLIKKYKLNLNSENSRGYSLDVINNVLKFDDLDGFIELGFSTYLQDNPQLLRDDSKNILARLSIMVNAGLNPYSTEDRLSGSITNGKNFFVSNENLNNFRLSKVDEQIDDENYDILRNNDRVVVSKKTMELEIVKYLDNNYKQSDLEYNFDGVIISRIKFLRNLECLIKNNAEGNFVFCALTYNSVLDIEAIEFINNVILEFSGSQKKLNK